MKKLFIFVKLNKLSLVLIEKFINFFLNFTNEKEISGIYKDSGVHPATSGKLSGTKFWINLEMILLRYGFTVNIPDTL